jgi:hypothetical protein
MPDGVVLEHELTCQLGPGVQRDRRGAVEILLTERPDGLGSGGAVLREPSRQRLTFAAPDSRTGSNRARALMDFARPLSEHHWRTAVPGDGRRVGVLVHHVASVYPLEIRLAQMVAAGTPIVGVTWPTVHEMNAAHAVEHSNVTKDETLALDSTSCGASRTKSHAR